MNRSQLVRLSIILAALVFNSCPSWADSWQQTVAAKVSAQYETNPAMAPTNPGSVWEELLEPSYALMDKVGDNEWKAGINLLILRSSNVTLSQNRADPSASLDWSRQSDAGELGLSAKYDEVSTRTIGIDNTGPSLADGTRISRTISGSWGKALSERSTLSADGGYLDVSFNGGTLVDYVTRSGDMMFSYALSERNTTFLKLAYADYEPTIDNSLIPSSKFYNAMLGWNWKISDYLEGTLQAGEYKVNDAKSGMQGLASVQYTGQRTRLFLSAGSLVLPSGLGGFVKVDQANGNWSYDLNEQSKIGIDWGRQNSFYVTDITNVTTGTYITNTTTGAWIQHDLNSLWGTRTYFQHRIIANGVLSNASSNMLGISLTYTHPDF